jgi:hypothetical protein
MHTFKYPYLAGRVYSSSHNNVHTAAVCRYSRNKLVNVKMAFGMSTVVTLTQVNHAPRISVTSVSKRAVWRLFEDMR